MGKQENELVKVIETSELESQTAITLKERFLPFFEQAEDWKQKAEALVVTDVSQTAEMKMARIARLALKEIRVNADKARKELKEDSIRYGKAVQGIYNVIDYLIVPIESHLREQEDFIIITEANKRAEIKAIREMELQPFMDYVPYGLNFGSMEEEDYLKTLNGAKLQHQAKIEADIKEEQERIAKEKADAEARELQRLENERLKVEAEKREREIVIEREKAEKERKGLEEKAKKDREIADAKLKKEQEIARIANEKATAEKEKLEAQIKARNEADEKAKKESEAKLIAEQKAKELADKKAKSAPDKVKLIEFALTLDSLVLPELKSDDANKIITDSKGLLLKISNFIREKSELI